MAEVTIVYWRDIPAQVTAGSGRRAARVLLSERFQEAIDAAAMAAGLSGTDAYLEEWRRETVVREGYPATAIEEEARTRHADLVVIGTKGHSGLKHLLLGSVAERVVQKAPCPVLAVKTPE